MYPFLKAPITGLSASAPVLLVPHVLCDLPCVMIVVLLPFSIHIHPAVPALPNQDFPVGESLVGEEEAAGGSQGREEKRVFCSGPLCRAWWLQCLGVSSPVGPFEPCLHTQRAGAALLEVIAETGLATS